MRWIESLTHLRSATRLGPVALLVIVLSNGITGSYGEAEDRIGRIAQAIVEHFDGASQPASPKPQADAPAKRMVVLLPAALAAQTAAPANPLWHEQKIHNYLPHMSWPEVQDLLTRTDMVIIPIAALEQHALHLPIGTDFLNGLERAKLIAQKTDVLVAPILMPGNSPYHMGFPGTITLSSQTIQQVYFEAAQSLMKHGFRRFLLLNSHGGNQIITRYIADRINQETEGTAVELGDAAAPFLTRAPQSTPPTERVFDRHGGVGETSTSLYMFPNLVNMTAARRATLTMPEHLQKMLPLVVAGDPTATLVFLAEGLKARETGKKTSTREMTDTGTWGLRDPNEASAEAGRRDTENFVQAAVAFIEKWKQLRPMNR
jgi:creatinine amidohydrolase